MCMGMMNYRKPKEELAVISCKKCGRAWQVTESDAREFKEHKELCPECRNKSEEKKVSLLKKKTNFDSLKDLSAWDFAGKMDYLIEGDCDICPFSTKVSDERKYEQKCRLFDNRPLTCRQKYRQWLESEAE